MKLSSLATIAAGELVGDGEVSITRVSELAAAGEGSIALAIGAMVTIVPDSSATALIVAHEADAAGRPAIVCANPKKGFAKILETLAPPIPPAPGIHPTAVVGDGAALGRNISIGPHSSIGANVNIGDAVSLGAGVRIGDSVTIGDGCRIFDNVVLYECVTLGDNVRIHANSSIGADGYGYTPDTDGSHYKIPQIGCVVIGDNVEIGANCCVDRATLGQTIIGAGTKIDNHVQIAHNCHIGKNVIIAGQEAVGGSSTIADNVIIGGGGAVSDNVTIGPGVIIGGFSGVHSSITKPGTYSGSLVMKHQAYKKFMLSGKRLDQMEKKLKEWEKREKQRELER